jgi:hypothetical protein
MTNYTGIDLTKTIVLNYMRPDRTNGFNMLPAPTITVISGSTSQAVYRGWLTGNYVYSTGTPPIGASDIVIVRHT